MSKEKQLKDTVEKWFNSVDVEDIECFQSMIGEVKEVIDCYVECIHKEQIKTIMFKMNMLESFIDGMYYDKTEEAEKESNDIIIKLKSELGFDERFMDLKIKW